MEDFLWGEIHSTGLVSRPNTVLVDEKESPPSLPRAPMEERKEEYEMNEREKTELYNAVNHLWDGHSERAYGFRVTFFTEGGQVSISYGSEITESDRIDSLAIEIAELREYIKAVEEKSHKHEIYMA